MYNAKVKTITNYFANVLRTTKSETSKRKEEKEEESDSDSSPPPKKKTVRKSGKSSAELKKILENKAIPESLKCLICKEIYIQPQLYTCGHSVCKVNSIIYF